MMLDVVIALYLAGYAVWQLDERRRSRARRKNDRLKWN